jgi:uncharacterized protein YegP (UPF0339 family)
MKATFEINRAADGKYFFNLKAANDQIILTSQTYHTKESSQEGIAAIRQNALLDDRYEEKSGDSHPYFVLKAANNQVIGRSQMYSSREAMRKGIESVKKNAPIAETADFSGHVQGSQGAA